MTENSAEHQRAADNHLSAILLAAGEGSRMKSDRPKPLHRLCGKPMITYVLDSLELCQPGRAVIVVGHKAERVTQSVGREQTATPITFVEQPVQRGTGEAALIGLTGLHEDTDDGDVLILPGDTPLLRAETILELVTEHRRSGAAATVLTAEIDDPTGYGRVIRGKGSGVTKIVEHRDANEEELAVNEINTSIYCFKHSLLAPALRRLTPDNAQGEYYLTDALAVLVDAGHHVHAVVASSAEEVAGVNDRVQLAAAETELRRRTNTELLRCGVTMLDPSATYVDTTVSVGRDVTLFPGVILQGTTTIGEGSEIGPNTRLVDCSVGDNAHVQSTSGRGAVIGSDSVVGPFANLSPGSNVPPGTRTGPFYNSANA